MGGYSHYPLQKAMFSSIRGDAAIMSLISGAYDRPPQQSAFPYLSLGEWVTENWGGQGLLGVKHSVLLQVWSRGGGQKEAVGIVARLHTILHDAALEVEGQTLVMLRVESTKISVADDGSTYRGDVGLVAITHES